MNLTTSNFLKLAPSLLALAVAGCASYTAADLNAPTADFSGGWFSEPGVQVVFTESGASATAHFQGNLVGSVDQLLGTNNPMVTGNIKGRVFQGMTTVPGLFGPENKPVAFTQTQDGKTGVWDMPYLQGTRFYRVELGPASQFAALDPLLPQTGGIICNLPVLEDGSVSDRFGPELAGQAIGQALVGGGVARNTSIPRAGLREVLVSFFHGYTDSGDVIPGWALVPVAPPRRVRIVGEGSSGISALVPRRGKCLNARRPGGLCCMQQITVDGRNCWAATTPAWNRNDNELTPKYLMVEVYESDPAQGAVPVEVERLASHGSDGQWHATSSYLITASQPTIVRGTLDGEKVVKLEAIQGRGPPLNTLISPEKSSGPPVLRGRWRNRMLLVAKNEELPRLLRDSKSSELTALASKIEQAILDYNHEGELLKDKTARAVEAGSEQVNSKEVDRTREIALVYKEKIEILKPILAAVKEEIANRAR